MKCNNSMALKHEVSENSGEMSRVRKMQSGRPHLHFLSFTNFLVVVGWRRQPHVAEGQLSLWLPATARRHRHKTQTLVSLSTITGDKIEYRHTVQAVQLKLFFTLHIGIAMTWVYRPLTAVQHINRNNENTN